jgi:hypothetical protein
VAPVQFLDGMLIRLGTGLDRRAVGCSSLGSRHGDVRGRHPQGIGAEKDQAGRDKTDEAGGAG